MNKIFFFIFLFLVQASSAQIAQEGSELLFTERIQNIKTKNLQSKISKTENGSLLIETLTQPKFIYKMASSLPLKKNNAYKDGRVFLLSFYAKTVESSEETGEAKIHWQMRQSETFKDNLERTLSIGSSWQQYFIPFKATKKIKKGDLGVVMQYGYSPQSFEIKEISFKEFPAGTELESLPKTQITYAGMSEDAPWREQANARINKLRKGDFTLQIVKDGKPLQNKEVCVELQQHYFPFGAAMNAQDILEDEVMYKRFKNAFGFVVLANDLKIKSWSKEQNRKRTLKAIEKLRNDNISIKGHVLIWPGFRYNTSQIKENKDNPDEIKRIIKNHVASILNDTKGNITHWDVTNETYTNRDFQKIMGGEGLLYDGFKWLRANQPEVGRFTNEYGIISKGGIDFKKQKWYYEYIKRVDKFTDNAVQGIGIQSHIGSDLTPPERVLELLAFYGTLGKKISISEFTMDIEDPAIREQYTRDFMIAAFSHPNVSEFLFWGFQEDGRRKVDIYEEDGSIGEMGKAFFSLVYDKWKTKIVSETNEQGTLSGNAFYGLYKVTYMDEGKEKTSYVEITPQSNNQLKISL